MATPNVDKLFNTMRETLSERAWSQGVNVARSGGVVGLTADEDELRLSVVSTMRPSPYEVHLSPGDEEWSCECGHAACVHAAAAVIAAKQAIFEGKTMPKPQNAAQPMVVTLEGMEISVSPLHTKNASLPMLTTLDGMVTLGRPTQASNVLSPMLVMQAGMVML